MSMNPGRDGQAGGVDLAAVRLERADRRDAAVLHADVGHAALRARAVVDRAAADDDVEAHARRRPAVRDHDAVSLARRLDAHLPVEHVLEHERRIALERRAAAAAARGDVVEDVALAQLQRLHRHRRDGALAVGRPDRVRRRRSRLPALDPVGRVEAPVGADGQHRLVGQQLVRALEGETAAEAPGAARVGDEPVAVHPQRQVALDQLHRLVREVGERVRHALEAVSGGPRAPAADEHLREHEGLPAL